MILCVKTDNPTAELYLYDGDSEVARDVWQADRSLAKDLLSHIEVLLAEHGSWKGLTGLIVYEGPGSFTGLRIGITVMNTLADGLAIPIFGTSGDDWIALGMSHIYKGDDQRIVLPFYGSEPHITQPKK